MYLQYSEYVRQTDPVKTSNISEIGILPVPRSNSLINKSVVLPGIIGNKDLHQGIRIFYAGDPGTNVLRYHKITPSFFVLPSDPGFYMHSSNAWVEIIDGITTFKTALIADAPLDVKRVKFDENGSITDVQYLSAYTDGETIIAGDQLSAKDVQIPSIVHDAMVNNEAILVLDDEQIIKGFITGGGHLTMSIMYNKQNINSGIDILLKDHAGTTVKTLAIADSGDAPDPNNAFNSLSMDTSQIVVKNVDIGAIGAGEYTIEIGISNQSGALIVYDMTLLNSPDADDVSGLFYKVGEYQNYYLYKAEHAPLDHSNTNINFGTVTPSDWHLNPFNGELWASKDDGMDDTFSYTSKWPFAIYTEQIESKYRALFLLSQTIDSNKTIGFL